MPLSEKVIRDLKPGPTTAICWDDKVSGLGVRVTPRGRLSFVLRYRGAEKKQRLLTLGRCDELSLRAARDRAAKQLVDIRRGEDPLGRREEMLKAPSVSDLWEAFFTQEAPRRIARGQLRQRTVNWYRDLYRAHIEPDLGPLKVAEVRRGDVERALAKAGDASFNASLALLSRLFTLAERWEWREQNRNPARGIERAKMAPRDRTLTADELGALAEALSGVEGRSPASVSAIRFASLTGLRIGEVLSMQWPDIDFETRRLTLPETKTGRRAHDLPGPAIQVLAALPRRGAWVFTICGTEPISYKRVRACLARACEAAGLVDVRLHDLRRTLITRAAMSGLSAHVLRDLLGHRDATMADRYIRSLNAPVRDAREAVAGEMAALMGGGKSGDVVPWPGRK